MSKECSGGKVWHPATHKETVTLTRGSRKTTEWGYVCPDHKTQASDWEVEGWEVSSIRRARL